VVKLDRTYQKMLIAEGNFIIPIPVFRGGIAELKLKVPVADFLKRTIEEGFEHHVCLVHGDHIKELEIICKLLEIDIVKVG
jgi:L-fucose isomerase-like protein